MLLHGARLGDAKLLQAGQDHFARAPRLNPLKRSVTKRLSGSDCLFLASNIVNTTEFGTSYRIVDRSVAKKSTVIHFDTNYHRPSIEVSKAARSDTTQRDHPSVSDREVATTTAETMQAPPAVRTANM